MPNDTYKFEARDLSRIFGHGKKQRTAVDRVSFRIKDREIVSLVGQSASGKTVLGKLLLRLEKPTSGELLFDGKPIDAAVDPREHWRKVQAVFQDPFSAFNQFFTIRAQLKSSFRLFPERPSPAEMEARVDEALMAVNIKPREIDGKYPFELSGGQMQRMLLARIFILKPHVLVADEPTSMVDACSRASILEYLM
jgi:peptide/nickel transport system ATP-binding protein